MKLLAYLATLPLTGTEAKRIRRSGMDRASINAIPAPHHERPVSPILPETPKDAQAHRTPARAHFGPAVRASAYRLREHVDHLLELSFTARIGTLLVGPSGQLPVCIGDTSALMLGH